MAVSEMVLGALDTTGMTSAITLCAPRRGPSLWDM